MGGPGDALVATWERLTRHLDGWARVQGRTIAAVTGVPIPAMNGVWSVDGDVEVAVVDALLDEVAARGVPFCLQVPTAVTSRFAPVAAAHGLVHDEDVPLMRLDGPSRSARPAAEGVVVRPLSAADLHLHHELGAAGFDAPLEVFERMIPPSMAEMGGFRGYVAEVDGVPVSTGIRVRVGEAVGIFNIATPAQHRCHGYGAAVTARLADDAIAEGARWAWLQSSQPGFHVYETLGFTTVDTWRAWVTGADQ